VPIVKQQELDKMITRYYQKYRPHLGYIGKEKLSVPNYLFQSNNKTQIETVKNSEAYPHCKLLTEYLLKHSTKEHFKKSNALTDFLKKREMTFSKLGSNGQYQIFSVPCTTTPLSIPKSLFNEIESSAQVLVATARLILQDIYGSEDVQSAAFVKKLPKDLKDTFINAIESSPHYFPQLHHPVMKSYPFFDVVGLDLVKTNDFTAEMEARNELPFKVLELNAGSPSGAANNSHILEGLAQIDPEILFSLGKVFSNDHYKILGETYKSLGETWTNNQNGIQIVLPPGGENGATPEIHQLAALSGLIYADAGQLFQDEKGFIRLRTVNDTNPIVTGIYSRVNSDSALFDQKRNLILRDPESGKPIYLIDPLQGLVQNKVKPLKNKNGDPIPLESDYAIPGAIEAIHDRKLYLGGLNRILDNKIILSTLCEIAPSILEKELADLGIDVLNTKCIAPPRSLPSTAASIEKIQQNPDNWVIKAPSLSGGKGVYILKTLSQKEKFSIIRKAKASPKKYAYQELVRIGRIPVAQKRFGKNKIEFANIAADLRMWAFYGAGEAHKKPKLTHNALIRIAPEEQGPLSSIVNTSQGGGYGSMFVIDDIGHDQSVPAIEITKPFSPKALSCPLPVFVGAQITQIAHMVNDIKTVLRSQKANCYSTYIQVSNLKKQCREVLSFLHPRNIECINEMLDKLEKKLPLKEIYDFEEKLNKIKIHLVEVLTQAEADVSYNLLYLFDSLFVLNSNFTFTNYNLRSQRKDIETLKKIELIFKENRKIKSHLKPIVKSISNLVQKSTTFSRLSTKDCQVLLFHIEKFGMLAHDHLQAEKNAREFASLFSNSIKIEKEQYDIIFSESEATRKVEYSTLPAKIASEEEDRTGKRLIETDFVSSDLQSARLDWLNVLKEIKSGKKTNPDIFDKAREYHFSKYPFLKDFQNMIDTFPQTPSYQSILDLIPVLPYAQYNLIQFAKEQSSQPIDVFSKKLTNKRISLLNPEERQNSGLSKHTIAGECFALKRHSHGLFSNSEVYLWIASELHPLIQGYTAGHELIHLQQIQSLMEKEKNALNKGETEFAGFFNFFGNFLGLSCGTLENISADSVLDRKPIYGMGDLLLRNDREINWLSNLKNTLKSKNSNTWNLKTNQLGSWLNYSTDPTSVAKVKALREVIPALENSKNIRFAKELGLKINLNEIQSTLPTANKEQIRIFTPFINQLIESPKLIWEGLRIVANHQYHGVQFRIDEVSEEHFGLKPDLKPMTLGGSYNQTQQ